MKFQFQEGSKSKAICPECQEIVNTTFAYNDDKLLVGVCDQCGDIVSIPHQSTDRSSNG